MATKQITIVDSMRLYCTAFQHFIVRMRFNKIQMYKEIKFNVNDSTGQRKQNYAHGYEYRPIRKIVLTWPWHGIICLRDVP